MNNDNNTSYLKLLTNRGHWGIKCGLENPKKLLQTLNNPHNHAKIILIAGTNGKGSTGAFIANALIACGINVGWTTSPHLVSPTERIWINGANIDSKRLENLLCIAFKAEKQINIQATYFELMITAAFQAFKEDNVDVAIVEVGMGGRWDATNTTDPIVTVLTNVEIDHTNYLGNTREEIAREKLCTARPKRPLIIGPTINTNWVLPLLECSPVIVSAPTIKADLIAWDHSIVQGHKIHLAGQHQLDNLSIALEVIKVLKQDYDFNINLATAWRGIEKTRWPGRLWQVPGLTNVYMDGAHNLDGTRSLAHHIRQLEVRPHLFFSAMNDKDLQGMKTYLSSTDPALITLVSGSSTRYATPRQLKNVWGESINVLDIPKAAELLKQSSPHYRLVCGSLYFIGDLLSYLGVQLK